MASGAFKITEHNAAEMTDDDIAVVLELQNAVSAEMLPGDPPTPLETAIAAHRAVPERMRRFGYRAWGADGSLAGAISARFDPEHDDNPEVMGTLPVVAQPYRRQGLGLQLMAYAVALARQEGRKRIITNTFEPIPAGPAFLTPLGGESKSEVHMNHLPTAEVDRSLMEQWVADGPNRAEDYELIAWDGPCPNEHAEAFVDLVLVMNDAPRDDLELNDFTFSVKELREGEKHMLAAGGEQWTVVARRKSDGTLAGFHDVTWMPHEPTNIYVGATGVRPEHRGHALGKWLKATMTLRILDERPGVVDIRTGNADSNDAMLGINREMGYRPLMGNAAWELDVETVASRLAERGIDIPALTLTIR